jgi:hypothetical protein
MNLEININLIPYVIKNNLHVEYFLWCYLREQNSTGIHDFNSIDFNRFCKSSIKLKSKKNVFFDFQNNKYILSSSKKIMGKKINYTCDFKEVNRFANKITASGKIIKKWNSTLIKYFLVSVYACRHQSKKPYALKLISQDLDISEKTIQRSLEIFGVQRMNKVQENYSPRSYYYQGKLVNLSPNYYTMSFGKMSNSSF